MKYTLKIPATVSVRDVQRKYSSIFRQVNETQEPVVVVANNTPQAVVMSIAEYNAFAEYKSRQAFWAELEREKRAVSQIPGEDAEAEIETVIKEVRAARQRSSTRRS